MFASQDLCEWVNNNKKEAKAAEEAAAAGGEEVAGEEGGEKAVVLVEEWDWRTNNNMRSIENVYALKCGVLHFQDMFMSLWFWGCWI